MARQVGAVERERVGVGAARRVREPLLLLLLALGPGADDDDGDGGVLQAVLGDGAGEEALQAVEGAAARANDKAGGLVGVDLEERVN